MSQLTRTKFKIGDKVKCVDANGSFTKTDLIKNKVYYIVHISKNYNQEDRLILSLTKNGESFGDGRWRTDRFVLVDRFKRNLPEWW